MPQLSDVEFLNLAQHCGAVITGKPDASEAVSVVFTPEAWRAFHAAQPASEFPAMTPQLESILGTMCFECINIVRALRMGGHDIKTRAEQEQAAALHWMLGHYFRHGDDWRKPAIKDMERMRDEYIAKNPNGDSNAPPV